MSDAERRAAAADLLRDTGALRVPIHGRSMLPSIREPMVLQIGKADDARIGDVLVFRLGDTRVAHRIVARDGDAYRTSGDAQPDVVETVRPEMVIGRVVAIWSDASSAAFRVDGPAHRVRAWYLARFHAPRGRMRRVNVKLADLAARALPRRRKRMTLRLLDGVSAAVHDTPERLVAALSSTELELRAVERHRCAALLGEAVRRAGVTGRLPPEIAAYLRRSRLEALLGVSRMHEAVCAAVAIVRETGAKFALLKGAARVYLGMPEAACHLSDDIDILVQEVDLDRVVAAFLTHGYGYREDAQGVRQFRTRHHHAAALFSPDGSFPIEVHRALAPPSWLSTRTDWPAIEGYLVAADGPAGQILYLDAFGTALHLTAHALGLERMRDIALLAQTLLRLDAHERRELRTIVRAERIDPIRLEAPLALAARLARLPWPAETEVAQYVRWALRREDLPMRLRTRCAAAELYFAQPKRPWLAGRQLVPWWSRGPQLLAVLPRIVGRCCSNAAALLYARLLSDPGGGTLS